MDNFWTDELVAEFTTWSLLESPLHQGRYKDIEDFKKRKESKPIQDYEIVRYGSKEFSVDANLKDMYYEDSPIFSVKRLSDNEVFSIGDKIYWYPQITDDTTTLTEFRYINDTKNLNVYGEGFGVDFSLIQKVKPIPKVPKFTTVDGSDFYEDDLRIVYALHSDFNYYKAKAEYCDPKCNVKYFLHEDNCKEYIWQNKPQLISYKELHDYYRAQVKPMQPYEDRIKLFFKSKINNT